MNDWLSKIEQHDHEVREQYPELEVKELESEQMARVIRELVDVASATVPAYKRLVLLQKMGPLGESPLWTKKIGEALSNLSPDAKELLE